MRVARDRLFRHLGAVVHVNAYDFATVLPLARHEVKVRLVRLSRDAAAATASGRAQVLRALILLPAILGVIARLDRGGMPSTRRSWKTVRSSWSHHPVRAVDPLEAHADSVSGHFAVSRQARNRRRRCLFFSFERLEREVRVRAGRVVLPSVVGDQAVLQEATETTSLNVYLIDPGSGVFLLRSCAEKL